MTIESNHNHPDEAAVAAGKARDLAGDAIDTTSLGDGNGVWNNPGGTYLDDAADTLGLRDDLETIGKQEHRLNVPVATYAPLDRVFRLAWLMKRADDNGFGPDWAMETFTEGERVAALP